MDPVAILVDPATTGAVVGALALILFGAAWHKLAEPNAFLSALAAYRLVPGPLLEPMARALPFLEFALGAGVLLPATRVAALAGTAALLVAYAAAIAVNLVRGRSYIDCGCGGAAHPLSWGLVLRNLLLAAAAVAVSGPTADRTLDWLDGFVLVAGGLAFFVAYLMADEVLRQASRMARTERSGQEGTHLS
jgi:hypothetical protein